MTSPPGRFLPALAGACACALATAAGSAPLREGDLLVLTDLGELLSVDPATGVAEPFVSLPFASGSRLSFDGAGDVLLRNRHTGEGLRVDRDSGALTSIADGGFLDGSYGGSTGVAVDTAGDVLLTAQISLGPGPVRGRVVRVDADGDQQLVSEGLYLPTAIAAEADGSILVSTGNFVLAGELYEGGVIRIDPASADASVVSSGGYLGSPTDLELAPDGSILVLELDGGIIVVDPLTGAQSLPPPPTSIGETVLIELVTGMASDGASGFYLTVGHDRFDEVWPGGVVQLVPGGALATVTKPAEFYSPSDVAIVPAPEPAAPALLLAGGTLLSLAATTRGRRKPPRARCLMVELGLLVH